jgi:hypothetical protein
MDNARPACRDHQEAVRQRIANNRGRGYLMFFAAMYTSPLIGTYFLGRYAYRKAEQAVISHRRKRVCKRAEDCDIARRPSMKPELTEENAENVLLRLPAELRLQVYDLIYASSKHIIIKEAGRKGHIQGVTWSKTYCPCVRTGCCIYSECTVPISNDIMALSLTCRTLYAETIGYVYSKNRFHFNQYQMITSIPSIIPAKHLRNIRSLSLNFAVDHLIKSLHLIVTNPSAKPSSPSYKFSLPTVLSLYERKDPWMELWRLFAITMIDLQRLSVIFNRISPKGIPALERQTCEWVIEPLLIFSDIGIRMQRFEVGLGYAWKHSLLEMQNRFAERCGEGGAPFVLKSQMGCIHDYY